MILQGGSFPCHKFPTFPISITKCDIRGGHVNVPGSKSQLSRGVGNPTSGEGGVGG